MVCVTAPLPLCGLLEPDAQLPGMNVVREVNAFARRTRETLFLVRSGGRIQAVACSSVIKSGSGGPGGRRFRQGSRIRTGVGSAKDQTFLNTKDTLEAPSREGILSANSIPQPPNDVFPSGAFDQEKGSGQPPRTPLTVSTRAIDGPCHVDKPASTTEASTGRCTTQTGVRSTPVSTRRSTRTSTLTVPGQG
jgi:hypothetical protein